MSTESAAFMAEIDRLVERRMAEARTPGVALAVTDRERLLYTRAYGVAAVEGGAPLTLTHRMEFGSIGKSVTALVLLQLQAEGRLRLDDPVERYLPWFRVQNAPSIRLHHLLSHTSGLIGGTDFPPDARLEVWSLRDTRTVWPPGSRFHYSNVGFKTLGLILQEVSGRTYQELVAERVLAPLNMGETDAVITHALRPRLAVGHQSLYDDRPYWPGDPLVPAPWIETDTADGCLSSTAPDLARYVRLFLNGGQAGSTPLLAPADFRRLIAPVIETGPGEWYALGIGRRGQDPDAVIEHSGGMLGYHAHIMADPASGLGVAVLINGPGDPERIAAAALRAAGGHDVLRADDRAGAPDGAARWAGAFSSPAGDVIELIAAGAGVIEARFNGEALPDPVVKGPDALLLHHPALSRFLLERPRESGSASAFYHGGTLYRAGGETGGPEEPSPQQSSVTGHYRSHDPWDSNFRVVARGPDFYWIPPQGVSARLWPHADDPDRFSLSDEDGPLPEELRFGARPDGGQVWEAWLAGNPFARFFTP